MPSSVYCTNRNAYAKAMECSYYWRTTTVAFRGPPASNLAEGAEFLASWWAASRSLLLLPKHRIHQLQYEVAKLLASDLLQMTVRRVGALGIDDRRSHSGLDRFRDFEHFTQLAGITLVGQAQLLADLPSLLVDGEPPGTERIRGEHEDTNPLTGHHLRGPLCLRLPTDVDVAAPGGRDMPAAVRVVELMAYVPHDSY